MIMASTGAISLAGLILLSHVRRFSAHHSIKRFFLLCVSSDCAQLAHLGAPFGPRLRGRSTLASSGGQGCPEREAKANHGFGVVLASILISASSVLRDVPACWRWLVADQAPAGLLAAGGGNSAPGGGEDGPLGAPAGGS